MRLEKYREAWHLLDPPLTIQACIDPDYPEEANPEGYEPELKGDSLDEKTEPSGD
jgi:hypothetical protein